MNMRPIILLVILAVLLVVGSYIGNWHQFKLRNTELELRGALSGHQYIVNSKTGELLVPQNVVDIERKNEYIFLLRELASTYECVMEPVGDKLLFTHFDGIYEVIVINLQTENKNLYSETEFKKWVSSSGLKNPFHFEKPYDNDNAFSKLNKNYLCSPIQ